MDNVQLKTVSKQDFGIINLTNKDIPKELEQFLQFGANYAPHVPLSSMEVEELFGNELLAATRNMFIDTYKQFPFQNKKGDVTGNLKLLLSQVPSNSKEAEFINSIQDMYYDWCNTYNSQGSGSHYLNHLKMLIPRGTALTVSGKGLGICLIPLEWYVQQYEI